MAQRPKHLKKCDRFPRLAKKRNDVASDADPNYNCIAFAIGRTDKKIWPVFHPDHWWPPTVPTQGDPMECLIALFESEGYRRCADGRYVAGVEKVALYAKPWGTPTHAAKQVGRDRWASKLGNWYDIEHTETAVSGGDYGQIVIYMERRQRQAAP
jgi:hypothetical protein